MADVDFDEFERGYEPPFAPQAVPAGTGFSVSTLVGAVTSLGLLIGAGVWGYQIAERDRAGVPVIHASGGPMRVAPENPGGEIATHQGLAVNSVVEKGASDAMPDRLVLAPLEQDLLADDQAGLSALPPPPAAAPDAGAAVPDAATPTLAPDLAAAAPDLAAPADPLAADAPETAPELAPDLADPSVPVMSGMAPATGADADAVADALAEALADGGSPAVPVAESAETPRPKPRPGTDTPADPNAPTDSPVAEVDPASIATGTRLVQLGAFDSAELARGEWDRLAQQFGPLWQGKSLVIQSAESGGRTFYRLRALGFEDEAASRDFCTALLQQNASCIPVEQR